MRAVQHHGQRVEGSCFGERGDVGGGGGLVEGRLSGGWEGGRGGGYGFGFGFGFGFGLRLSGSGGGLRVGGK